MCAGHRIQTLTPEKSELLKIIAGEIVNRLKGFKVIDDLKNKLKDANEIKRKVAHDIRGPLGGIIGLAQLINQQGSTNNMDEVLEYTAYKSGHSILELADEILTGDDLKPLKDDQFSLLLFKDKLEKLYRPQAKNKNILFNINISQQSSAIPFSKNKLLQIAGNLISNAMKFTPVNGSVTVDLDLNVKNTLHIKVTDTGIGLNKSAIENILNSDAHQQPAQKASRVMGLGWCWLNI
jgi:signal transduction histidine kinase